MPIFKVKTSYFILSNQSRGDEDKYKSKHYQVVI